MCTAIPYYGRLLRPGRGLERVYFHVETDEAAARGYSWSLRIWDPLKVDLGRWLQEEGVSRLVCRDGSVQLESELAACGIQTEKGQDDDFERLRAQLQVEVG